MATAISTVPKKYDSSACGNAFRRVSLSSGSTSGAAYYMPIVKAK